MRRGGASAHPASTQQILELRDQSLNWVGRTRWRANC
jgi:hypothetical protein